MVKRYRCKTYRYRLWSKKKLDKTLSWTDEKIHPYNQAMLTLTDCQLCGLKLPVKVDKFMIESRRVCLPCWEKCMKGDYEFVVKGFQDGKNLL